MEVFNLFDGDLDPPRPDAPPGFRAMRRKVGALLGATGIGVSLYELPPGEAIWPYHYEWGNEEWLLVLEGTITLRNPSGEQPLAPGALVCFPEGPDGAHLVRNDAAVAARVAIISTMRDPAIAEFPDSEKIGVWAGEVSHMLRRSAQLDYWDGEA
ncbi:MAG: cupin domain-containing protein [Solirubrobacteraceae bacterium]